MKLNWGFKNRIKVLMCLGTGMVLLQCATIVHGPIQNVSLVSQPAKAQYVIDEQLKGTTPDTVRLKRNTRHSFKVEMPGYKPEFKIIKQKISPYFWGNLIFLPFFFVGMGTDMLVGSMHVLDTQNFKINLDTLDGPQLPSIPLPKLAVLDLNSLGVAPHVSKLLSEKMRSDLFAIGKHIVMNREDMSQVMTEQQFQNSDQCDTEDCAVELGKILGVSKVITGSIGKLGKTYSLTVKLIDVETSKNDRIININKKCTEDDLFLLITKSAKELTSTNL